MIGVEVHRGGTVESAHHVHLAVCDGSGNLVKSFGNPEFVTFLRSSAKPFQAIPLVASGAADAFGLTPQELALACGSHLGEDMHTRAALAMLARVGLDENALRCGTHAPRSPGAQVTPICHNCSGKHAGFILLQKHLGGDAADYWKADSLAQLAVREAIEKLAGTTAKVGTDGCGVPNYAFPLSVSAAMTARFAFAPEGSPMARLRRAMTAFPEMVGGSTAFDSDLMGASEDRLFAKGGAEGFQIVGDLHSGMGIALKIEDGDAAKRATASATVDALRQLGWLEGRAFEVLGDWWRPAIENASGRVVGEVKPVLELE